MRLKFSLPAGEIQAGFLYPITPQMSLRKHTTGVKLLSWRSTIYTSTEVGLTKATKALLADRDKRAHYPEPIRFDEPKPYVKQDNRPVKRYVKKRVKIEVLEAFQQQRLFSVIRGMNG